MEFYKIGDYDKLLALGSEPKKLEGMIRDYIIHSKTAKKLSYNSVRLYVAAIAHFFTFNDITLNWKKLAKFKGNKRLVAEDKPYSKEQIRGLLDFADLRLKCIILLMCSAGLRRGGIPTLRVGDLEKIERHSLYKISMHKKEREKLIQLSALLNVQST
jgi:integrase